MDVEGIFREKGNILKQRIIEEELRADTFPLNNDYSSYDPHDIANIIKVFFLFIYVYILIIYYKLIILFKYI